MRRFNIQSTTGCAAIGIISAMIYPIDSQFFKWLFLDAALLALWFSLVSMLEKVNG